VFNKNIIGRERTGKVFSSSQQSCFSSGKNDQLLSLFYSAKIIGLSNQIKPSQFNQQFVNNKPACCSYVRVAVPELRVFWLPETF
jgi:hypothetical protein